ncbi:acyltransferase [Jeotgalibacillus sp. R-1-5s-1]|nr:acyltransferase [Jeotgalibacillus sp. R-1-5s-1]
MMVVLVHVSAVYFYERGGWEDVTLFVNQISRFGTPLFAFISGFLLFLQVKNKGFKFKKFASSRFKKIVIPFAVWTAFYYLYIFAADGISPFEDGTTQFLISSIFGESYYHLYFMSIVLQFYLIFPLLQLIRKKSFWIAALVLSAGVHVYTLQYFVPGQFEGTAGMILSQRAFLPAWLFFFIFGGFLAYNWEQAKAFAIKFRMPLFIGVLLIIYFAAVEYEAVGSIPSNRMTNMINLPIIILFILSIGNVIGRIPSLNQFFSKIGALSMGIYLVHPFILNVIQRILPAEVWKLSLFPVWFVIIMGLSIVAVTLIQYLPFGKLIVTVPKQSSTPRKDKDINTHSKRRALYE